MKRVFSKRRLASGKGLVLAGFAVLIAMGVSAEMRTWTVSSGQSLEAEYLRTTMSDEAQLRKADGNEIAVPLKMLSAEDLSYIDLQHPPKLKVEYGKYSRRDSMDSNCTPELGADLKIVQQVTYTFNVRIRQTDSKDYPFNLRVEYYAIGRQFQNKDKHVILYKYTTDLVLNDENKREFKWVSQEIKTPMEFTLDETTFGRDYVGGMILIYDERGEVIAHKEVRDWLFDNREKLRELPVGSFIDRECNRIHPSGAMKSANQ
jgi:hypothetical protein